MKNIFAKILIFIKKYILNFVKGVVLGASIIVPGVSGGTMAIILNVYDKIIHSINNIFKFFKKNIVFLLVVGVGAVLGVLSLSNVIGIVIEKFPAVTNYLFIGIVLGSFPIIIKQSEITRSGFINNKKRIPLYAILLILGAGCIIALSFLKEGIVDLSSQTGFVGIFFNAAAGFVTAIALVLPGISGSLFLKSIGLFDVFISSLSFSSFNFFFLLPFGLGLIAGVLLTAKVLESFLNKHKQATFIVIIGFILGTLVSMFMDKNTVPYNMEILYSIIALIIGTAITLSMFLISRKKEQLKVSNLPPQEIPPGKLQDINQDTSQGTNQKINSLKEE